jgi:rhodanese-related sulfurtransferase
MTVANNDSNDNSKNKNLRITSNELKKKIDKAEDIFVLDVRNQHEYDSRNVLLQS